ncbi:hypothetical protein E2C01_013107 [Portunus trituberculatus]|uniref:DUF7920 domain-containing protein n=1 Tax=Portunus trituberculatus TaxID=210409 RepID=A0A5B7DGG9_PORTR|nr:hypothetical protein [Portunus trituberculatus]
MEDSETIQLLEDMNTVMCKKHTTSTRLPESVSGAVKRMIESARYNATAAQGLSDFAKLMVAEKLLKISSSGIPEDILPENYEGIIHDIKVSGYHADDKIYSNNAEIRQKIPRGTTLLELKKSGEEETIQDVLIYANRKFTGDIGDEDDVQQPESNEWKKYFLKDQDKAQRVVCMKKINGEAAHFSARKINGKFYIITGSKNVHMIIKEKEDIDKYIGDRFTVAKIVARCLWDTLHELEEKHFNLLLKFLDLTKCTAICELLQPENQHIMNLSQLERPVLNVIGFTPPAGDESCSSLIALPPHHTLNFLSGLGLTTPTYTVIQVEDVQKYRDEIRHGEHGYHEEGEVLYFLTEDEETIGLVKAKTVWYIMLRALREKVVYGFRASRRRQQQNINECITSCHKRFYEIQEWLLFSNSFLDKWKTLAESFILWMAEEVREERVAVENIRPQYPVMWEKFLLVEQLTDRVELKYQDKT